LGKGSSQSVSQTVDPATQQYVQYMRRLAMGYTGAPAGTGSGAGGPSMTPTWGGGGLVGDTIRQAQAGANAANPYQPIMQGLPPGIQSAVDQYGQYAKGGNLGFSALTGDASAQQQFMSPYLSQMNPFFAQQRQQAIEQANQQATLAGAFGGDRSQIGAAVAGSQADQTQAGFNYQAFQDAMQRAGAAANLGFGAIGAGAFLPQQWQSGQLNLLNQALGPYGQTQTQQLHRDPFSQILGLGATGAGLFLGGPAGAAAGSGLLNYTPNYGGSGGFG